MAKTQTTPETTETDAVSDDEMDEGESITPTDPITVTEQSQAKSLLAAWRGVYHFFGGRVGQWEVNADGDLIAHDFTVSDKYDPNTILRDISGRDRRLDFVEAYRTVNGVAPEAYTEPQDMTNFMVNYLKGSVEDGTSKTPEYVRNAVAEYKAENGLKTRRGRKRTIIRLDNLGAVDEASLIGIDPTKLDHLIQMAQAAKTRAAATVAAHTPAHE